MVGLEAQVRVLAENRHEFLQTCELLSQQGSSNTACVSQTLFEKVGEPNQFLWVEHWVDLKSLEAHLQSEKYRMLLGAIEVLGELERMQVVELKTLPDL